MPTQPSFRLPRRISRRALLRSALMGGTGLLGAVLLSCGDDGQPASPGATATPAPGWRPLSPSGPVPPPRREHSLVTDGARLYLFGGRQTEALNDLWAYDIEANTWTELSPPNGPLARFGHNAVWDTGNGRLIVFGGQTGDAFLNDPWAFEPATNQWAELPSSGSVPEPRYGAGAALDSGGRLVVTHGCTTARRFNDTWQYDLNSQSWSDVSPEDEPPMARCLTRAVWDTLRDRLLLFGGQTTTTPFLGDLWSLSARGWTELARNPSPSPRTFYAMAFDGERNKVIVFGGKTEVGPANDLWLFDAQNEFWTAVEVEGELPSARFGHDAVWVAAASSLLVFGGNDGDADLNDLWELTLPA